MLRALGCNREVATEHLWAIDLPPATDIGTVRGLLESAAADGVWTVEEADVSHPGGKTTRRRKRRPPESTRRAKRPG